MVLKQTYLWIWESIALLCSSENNFSWRNWLQYHKKLHMQPYALPILWLKCRNDCAESTHKTMDFSKSPVMTRSDSLEQSMTATAWAVSLKGMFSPSSLGPRGFHQELQFLRYKPSRFVVVVYVGGHFSHSSSTLQLNNSDLLQAWSCTNTDGCRQSHFVLPKPLVRSTSPSSFCRKENQQKHSFL